MWSVRDDGSGGGSGRPVWVALIWLLPGAVWLFVNLVLKPPFPPYDDAFITFRYVRNILEGHGAVYNPGEAVFGVSTPLYMAWLSVVSLLTGHRIVIAALVSNLLFAWWTAGLITAWLSDAGWHPVSAAAAGMFFLFQPDVIRWGTGGMEPLFFTAVVLAGFLSYRRRRYRVAAAAAGMSVLIRPEGILPVVMMSAAELWRAVRRRRRPDGWVAAWLFAPALLCGVILKLFYGNWIPFSLIAKSRPLYPLPPWKTFHAMVGLMNDWVLRPEYALLGRLISPVSVVFLVLGLVGSVVYRRGNRSGWWVAAWFGGVFGAYAAGNPLLGEWYHPLLYVPWLTAMAMGLRNVGAMVPVMRRPLRRRAAEAVVIALMLVSVWRVWYRERPSSQSMRFQRSARLRVTAYEAAGRWLTARCPGCRVASPEIGALGYYFSGYVLDACGLVTPEALPFIPAPPEQRLSPGLGTITAGFVRVTRPDYVVTLRCFAAASLLKSPWFQRNYRLVHEIPLPLKVWKDSRAVWIYQRVEASPPKREMFAATPRGAPGA